MGKELSNGKMDKETIKHTIKTKYLNSYKVIVAGERDFDNYEFLKPEYQQYFAEMGVDDLIYPENFASLEIEAALKLTPQRQRLFAIRWRLKAS
jgi:hypothetical protein